MKKIYYYNRKYPEYEIKEMEVLDELYIKGKDTEYLYAITSMWSIDMDCEEDWDRIYHVYTPCDDGEILIHDSNLGNEIAMSFNKKIIEEWHEEDCQSLQHKLQERLKKLESRK